MGTHNPQFYFLSLDDWNTFFSSTLKGQVGLHLVIAYEEVDFSGTGMLDDTGEEKSYHHLFHIRNDRVISNDVPLDDHLIGKFLTHNELRNVIFLDCPAEVEKKMQGVLRGKHLTPIIAAVQKLVS